MKQAIIGSLLLEFVEGFSTADPEFSVSDTTTLTYFLK
jgi:hypothetical protein